MDDVDPNKNSCMIQCNNGHWNKITKDDNEDSWVLSKKKYTCIKCGTSIFNWRSLISIRTWDIKRKRNKKE